MQSIDSSDELPAELHEASSPPPGPAEDEPTGPEEGAPGDSEGLRRGSAESEAVGIEPHEETDRAAGGSPNEWQDIDLVITCRHAFTYSEGSQVM